jgi:hypothetical protein
MERKRIKQLSDKYWNADASEEEESDLMQGIRNSNDPTLDQEEVEYFKAIEEFSSQSLGDDFDKVMLSKIQDTELTSSFWGKHWFQMAASLLLAGGVVLAIGYNSYENKQIAKQKAAREAFETTKDLLMMVSSRLDKGTSHTINSLGKMEEVRLKVKNQITPIN